MFYSRKIVFCNILQHNRFLSLGCAIHIGTTEKLRERRYSQCGILTPTLVQIEQVYERMS